MADIPADAFIHPNAYFHPESATFSYQDPASASYSAKIARLKMAQRLSTSKKFPAIRKVEDCIDAAADYAVYDNYRADFKNGELQRRTWVIPIQFCEVPNSSATFNAIGDTSSGSPGSGSSMLANSASSRTSPPSTDTGTTEQISPSSHASRATYRTWRPNPNKPLRNDTTHLTAMGMQASKIISFDLATGQAYSCIPVAPYQFDRSPLCDHCGTATHPTRILDYEQLCYYHSFYLDTGRLLSWYELHGLDMLDAVGFQMDWDTVQKAVIMLSDAIDRRLFVHESEVLFVGAEGSKEPSKFGVIGSGRLRK